jgi:Ni/Co efflux regulator RcnB
MNRKTVLAVLIAMSLTMGDFAFAQGSSGQNQRARDEQTQRSDQGRERGGEAYRERRHDDRRDYQRRDYQRRDYQRRDYQRRDYDRRDYDRRAYEDGRRGPGAGPNRDFHRGDRLAVQYRHRNYVVDDWRGHRLSAPPRGYHWVQTGADYLLVAIATGIILQVVLSQ